MVRVVVAEPCAEAGVESVPFLDHAGAASGFGAEVGLFFAQVFDCCSSDEFSELVVDDVTGFGRGGGEVVEEFLPDERAAEFGVDVFSYGCF